MDLSSVVPRDVRFLRHYSHFASETYVSRSEGLHPREINAVLARSMTSAGLIDDPAELSCPAQASDVFGVLPAIRRKPRRHGSVLQ
jgi:hypothetical protein